MKKYLMFDLLLLAGICCGGMSAGTPAHVPARAEFFPLSAVRLTAGPLAQQQELNRRYLLQLDPDRLLNRFRVEAGLDPKAPPYRGWESEGLCLCGHILGFYMSGAAMTTAATGDAELRRRLLYIVDELAEVQRANGTGYALACPHGKRVFAEIASGKFRVTGHAKYGNHINGVFEPIYTMNKILLGLLEIHRATGYPKAREVFLALTDWFGTTVVERLDDDQLQRLLFCEHGSLPETFADAYLLTGAEKYRTWAKRLCHRRMLDPLAAGDGQFFTGHHANDTLPKYTGYERVYRITGDAQLHRAAVNAWDEIVNRRSWVIGGNGTNEHFHDRENFVDAMNGVGPESCNSVNMLRQTEALFQTDPDPRRADYYERTLLNHLLATHDATGMTCYYTPMAPNRYRVYSDPFDAMWCCTGTGLEAPGKYGRFIYTHTPDHASVAVQLFASSTLDWSTRGIRLEQKTNFPYEQGTTLTVTAAPAEGVDFTLNVRHPAWVAVKGFALTLNGKSLDVASPPSSYVPVRRVWKKGDTLRVALPMSLHVANLPGSVKRTEKFAAFLYGPVVLVGELGRQGLAKDQFWSFRSNRDTVPAQEAAPHPVAADPAALVSLLEPVPGEPLHFRSKGFWPREVRLVPFFELHYQRYAVYWERLTPAERDRQRAALARAAVLDRRTVDRVIPNNPKSERAHQVKGEQTNSGTGMYGTRHETAWRDARNGGWFSFRVACEGAKTLHTAYYGRERGARTFDVLLDGQLLKTENLGDTGVDDLVIHEIPLPPALLNGKKSVTITFKAHPGNCAGGLFDLRLLK